MKTRNQIVTVTLLALVPLPSMYAQRFAVAIRARAVCAASLGIRANQKPMLVLDSPLRAGFPASWRRFLNWLSRPYP